MASMDYPEYGRLPQTVRELVSERDRLKESVAALQARLGELIPRTELARWANDDCQEACQSLDPFVGELEAIVHRARLPRST